MLSTDPVALLERQIAKHPCTPEWVLHVQFVDAPHQR